MKKLFYDLGKTAIVSGLFFSLSYGSQKFIDSYMNHAMTNPESEIEKVVKQDVVSLDEMGVSNTLFSVGLLSLIGGIPYSLGNHIRRKRKPKE